ncbi:helix-turn-helix domain-containing protein [Neorhodopirellula lusitana]|uniref:helix-turn-helix domain-containing protein n=1 Tax=Neorhodopirellula lusitana TaxID=445327 RepID=UPI00384F16EE
MEIFKAVNSTIRGTADIEAKAIPNRDLFRPKEAAQKMGVSLRTLATYRKNGTVDSFKLGGCVFISQDAIDNFKNKRGMI